MRRFLSVFLLLAGCSTGGGGLMVASQMVGPAGGRAVSADGSLTLTIPAGALAADTPITIRALAPTELGAEWRDVDVSVAYELGPDGLVFQAPVTVVLRLDQSPVGPGGILQADAVFLVTESGAGIEVAGKQELASDSDAGVTTLTGEVEHFSRLIGVELGATLEVSGVPDFAAKSDIFSVDLEFRVAPDSKVYGTVWLRVLSKDALLAPEGEEYVDPEDPEEKDHSLVGTFEISQGNAVVFPNYGPFGCSSLGNGTFRAVAVFSQTELNLAVAPTLFKAFDIPYVVSVSKTVLHVGEAPVLRTFQLTHTALEGLYRAVGSFFPSLAQSAERSLVTVAGQDAWEIVDTDTGEELVSVATPTGATYGAVPLDDGGAPAVFAFGSWGASLWPWENGAFGAPVPMATGNITDAMPCTGGGLVFVDNTAGQIRFVEYVAGAYQVSGTVMDLANAVSAVQLPDGSILAVTDGDPGKLYTAANRQAPFVLVAEVGSSPRRVRALGDVAAISSYGSGLGFGDVTIASRAGGAWAIGFALVGPSSVGIDLKELGNGHIAVAATSFKTNEYRVVEVEPDGTYFADSLVALPAECTGPGHALWLPGDFNELAVSCHDSGVLAVIPVTAG